MRLEVLAAQHGNVLRTKTQNGYAEQNGCRRRQGLGRVIGCTSLGA